MNLPNVDDWITRISATEISAGVAAFTEVGGSRDAAAAFGAGKVPTPAAYVLEGSENPGENELTTGVSQLVSAEFSVWIVVSNFPGQDDPPETLAGDPLLQALRKVLLPALLGWAPPGCDPVEYAGGERLSSIDMGLILWRESFTTQYLMRKV